jgi:multidrug resistance efflux pump
MTNAPYFTVVSAAVLAYLCLPANAQLCNLNDDPVRCAQRYEAEVQKLSARIKVVERHLEQLRARTDLAKASADEATETVRRAIVISAGHVHTTSASEDGSTTAACAEGMAIVRVRIHETARAVDVVEIECGQASFSEP